MDQPKSQRDRMLAAIETAYDEHVDVMFKTLVANLIEGAAQGVSADAAVGMFARGMKFGHDAYQRAMAMVDTLTRDEPA